MGGELSLMGGCLIGCELCLTGGELCLMGGELCLTWGELCLMGGVTKATLKKPQEIHLSWQNIADIRCQLVYE